MHLITHNLLVVHSGHVTQAHKVVDQAIPLLVWPDIPSARKRPHHPIFLLRSDVRALN